MTNIDFNKNPKQEKALDTLLSNKFTLLYGGSRSGKSFIIMFLIIYRALKKKSRHVIVRLHFSDVKKSIVNETFPEVAEIMGVDYKLNKQDFYATFANGSEIHFSGIDESRGLEKILGTEFSTIWYNECSQIAYDAYTILKTRLAQKSGLVNRIFLDENPPKKSHWSYQIFFKHLEPSDKTLLKNPEQYGELKMNPADNEQNISDDYIEMLQSLPAKQRKRFLDGEFSDDELGALFTESNFNRNRVTVHPELKEVVISVDPATTAKMSSDETGIVVTGKGFDDRGYLLQDSSGIYTPKEWSKKVVSLYNKWDANWVVAETNQGGDMVKHTIQTADENIPVKGIHATKGKLLRAEPISAIYDSDRISHVGGFPDAEEEMCNYTGAVGDKSPNRLDALVYGFTHLFPVGVYSDSEIFNRDNLKYWKEYDFTDSYDFAYIKLTSTNSKNTDYNFLGLHAKIKDKKIFITDCIFNSMLPSDNLGQIKDKFVGAKRVFVECSPSFLAFAKELKVLGIPVRTIKEFTQEDNMIISESGFIRDYFVFEKGNESTYYKSFMQQLNAYTTESGANESCAANILPSMAYVVKRLMKQHLK
jgi:phage terminase large subunit-like protein